MIKYSVKKNTSEEPIGLYAAEFIPEDFVECTEEQYNVYEQQMQARIPQPSNEIKREQAYETRRCITWGGVSITVDKANDLWMKYHAEDSTIAMTLSGLIATAKEAIREEFPDEE